jgi:nucleotide-binding universal stress UspA family protein
VKFQLKRILFPVDFSERCRAAAPYVEALSIHFDAELILLHVLEPLTYNTSLSHRGIEPEDFDRLFDANLRRLRVERVVEHGEVARAIVECASQRLVDLIMIPTHGLGTYRRLILGSTTAKVLHDADCPVWTGVHLRNALRPEAVVCRKIMCAVNLEPGSVLIADWAKHLAEEYQAELTLMHVSSSGESREALDSLRDMVGSHANVRVEHGDPSKVVVRTAIELGADLVVIGRKPFADSQGRLDTTAYAIIRRSDCPVISV